MAFGVSEKYEMSANEQVALEAMELQTSGGVISGWGMEQHLTFIRYSALAALGKMPALDKIKDGAELAKALEAVPENKTLRALLCRNKDSQMLFAYPSNASRWLAKNKLITESGKGEFA